MKALITEAVHPCLIEGLDSMGYHCDQKLGISMLEVMSIIENYEAIVINSRLNLDRAFFDKAHKLRFVARTGSGMEIIDQKYAAKKGVQCFNSPEGNCNAVGEHALGMLLALLNKICLGYNEVISEQWQREANRGLELDGKCVAIIGYGFTGKAFAQKLKGFDVEVLAYDKYVLGFESGLVRESTLDEIYEKADIVSLHLPLTKEVELWFNKDRIQLFKKPFFLINTSRGKVVKTTDLIEALQSGKVRGACLDVLENERFDRYSDQDWAWFYGLKNQKNVILTPHIAGWTVESKERLARVLVNKIKAFYR